MSCFMPDRNPSNKRKTDVPQYKIYWDTGFVLFILVLG